MVALFSCLLHGLWSRYFFFLLFTHTRYLTQDKMVSILYFFLHSYTDICFSSCGGMRQDRELERCEYHANNHETSTSLFIYHLLCVPPNPLSPSLFSLTSFLPSLFVICKLQYSDSRVYIIRELEGCVSVWCTTPSSIKNQRKDQCGHGRQNDV